MPLPLSLPLLPLHGFPTPWQPLGGGGGGGGGGAGGGGGGGGGFAFPLPLSLPLFPLQGFPTPWQPPPAGGGGGGGGGGGLALPWPPPFPLLPPHGLPFPMEHGSPAPGFPLPLPFPPAFPLSPPLPLPLPGAGGGPLPFPLPPPLLLPFPGSGSFFPSATIRLVVDTVGVPAVSTIAPSSRCAPEAAGGAWLVTSNCSMAAGVGGVGGSAPACGGSSASCLLSPEAPRAFDSVGFTATSKVPLLPVSGGPAVSGLPIVTGGPRSARASALVNRPGAS